MSERENPPETDAPAPAAGAPKRRARLKVYLGYAPGVGKTYAMLAAARPLLASGKKVLVGVVETHGRDDTAKLAAGLPALPRRRVELRGGAAEELDLEAALARRPDVLLVDPLEHANAPGSRHEKRWQDVLDLLDAGIDVHTTLNVQHVESLNDVVAQITTIRVRETVPDALLDRADEVEIVDLPPEGLLARVADGKVRLPEKGRAQLLFRRGNLLALRELALRRAAERVDADVQAYREEHAIEAAWPASERILVCVGPSPASARLVRAARRMAAGLRAPWVAVCVELGHRPWNREDKARIDAHLRLAESLGGEVVRLAGADVAATLLDHARRHHVTRIVLGKPTHARIFDRLRGSLVDEVVRGSGDIDVHVISGDAPGGAESPGHRPSEPRPPGGHAWAAILVGAATGLAWLCRAYVAQPDVAMMYLLTIVVVATRFGRGPSIVAAGLSVVAYDFFFVPPYFTLTVSETRHVLTFAMMFGAGLFLSALALRIRRQEQSAQQREQRTAALYALSRELGSAIDPDDVAAVVARQTAGVFDCGAAVLLPDEARGLVTASSAGPAPDELEREPIVRWVLDHGKPAGIGTGTLPGAPVACFPIASGSHVLGVLALAPDARRPLGPDERDTVLAFARQAAIALSRAQLADAAKAAALRARTEEIRSSLLSTVSHDLRTPLASITGAATTLRDPTATLDEGERAELLDSICEEAERLERLVKNLLEMTRIESGGIELSREWMPVEEIIGSALTRLEAKLAGRAVTIDLAPDLPLVPVDPLLLEQVFLNLLENAEKYTPRSSPIEIRAREEDGVVVEVLDRGPGLPPGAEARVFDKFFRGDAGKSRGAGLGLAIVKGVALAHGGSISAANREGGGAVFRLRLPIVGTPPVVAAGPEDAAPEPPAAPAAIEARPAGGAA
jgi:two-component system sensor histidine kinase KdpD